VKVLILGGTRFVGRHIAEAMLASGHRVSVFNRGVTPDSLPPAVERLRGDRDADAPGLTALSGRDWDACFDCCGYTPGQVRPSAEMLRDRAGRYVFISAARVYGDPPSGPVDESFPLVPPAADDVTEIDDDTYGPLKVACERVVEETFGDRAAILRPQIVVGPYDTTERFSYWVRMAASREPMRGPGDGTDYLQVIDARDIGRFAVRVIEDRLAGAYNLAGPRITWEGLMRAMGTESVAWSNPAEHVKDGIPADALRLYRPIGSRLSALMRMNSSKAQAAGLVLSYPKQTISAIRAWLQEPESTTDDTDGDG
jgi:2'-hydroxyisoflavone reductase